VKYYFRILFEDEVWYLSYIEGTVGELIECKWTKQFNPDTEDLSNTSSIDDAKLCNNLIKWPSEIINEDGEVVNV